MKIPVLRIYRPLRLLTAATCSIGMSAAPVALATDFEWNSGSNSTWATGPWSPVGTPGASDNIVGVLGNGSLALDINRSINNINLTSMSGAWTILGPSSNGTSILSVGGSVTLGAVQPLTFRDNNANRLLSLVITNDLNVNGSNVNLGNNNTILTDVSVGGTTTVSSGRTLGIRAGSASLGATTVNGTMRIVNPGSSSTETRTVSVRWLDGSGTVEANNTTQTDVKGTLEISGAIAGNFSGVIRNSGGSAGSVVSVTKGGAGTQTLSGTSANTYTGLTTVNGGTLALAKTSGVNSISGGSKLNGGSLRLDASNQIGNIAAMELSGGTFDLNGLSEGTAVGAGLGALTVSLDSTINFGLGDNANIVHFSSVGTHTGSSLLSIINWNGTAVTGGGSERLLFTGLTTDFTSQFSQSDVRFNGITGYTAVDFGGGVFEVTAIPEPSTAAFLLGSGVLLFASRRIRRRGVRP